MPRIEIQQETYFRERRSTAAMDNPKFSELKIVVSSRKNYPQQIVGLGKVLTLGLGEERVSSVQQGNDPDSAFRQAMERGIEHFKNKK